MRYVSLFRLAVCAIFSFFIGSSSFAEGSVVEDGTVAVGGQTFRYLAAGSNGPSIVLLHGWPQSADEFRKIIPRLSQGSRVYAPDLSGIGGSTAPDQDWRKEALARDVAAFVEALQITDPIIVGHDMGGMVAYAYARLFPERLLGLVVLDVPIPGLDPWEEVASSSYAWHFDFHKQTGLAESLIMGRQAEYIRYFINSTSANPDAIPNGDVGLYAKAYGTPEQLRAGFELYRSFDEDAEFFRSRSGKFDLPVLLVGGQYSTQPLLPVMAKSFSAHGATDVSTRAIADAGHWLPEEQPGATAAVIAEFVMSLTGR